jgi:hypothetical protein
MTKNSFFSHLSGYSLEFPPDLDDWTRRTVIYSAPAGTRITEVTIMLYCHGFSGLVSFADVEVIPSPG